MGLYLFASSNLRSSSISSLLTVSVETLLLSARAAAAWSPGSMVRSAGYHVTNAASSHLTNHRPQPQPTLVHTPSLHFRTCTDGDSVRDNYFWKLGIFYLAISSIFSTLVDLITENLLKDWGHHRHRGDVEFSQLVTRYHYLKWIWSQSPDLNPTETHSCSRVQGGIVVVLWGAVWWVAQLPVGRGACAAPAVSCQDTSTR